MAGVAIFFAAGVCLGITCSTPSVVPLVAGAILLLVSLLCGHVGRLAAGAAPSLLLAVTCIGWTHAAARSESQPAPIAAVLSAPAGGVGVIGVLDDDAIPMGVSSNGATWKGRIQAERIRASRAVPWSDVAGPVWVRFQLPAAFRPPRYGERWAFNGHLSPGAPSLVRGAAPDPAFLAAGRSAHRITTGQGSEAIRLALEARDKARGILAHGIAAFPRESAILNSLLLGVRGQMPRETYQDFANTSTLHVFAISGSHVVILAGILVLALSACGMPRTRWILALGPVLLLYTVMTGLQSSATRACIMGILFWSAPLLGRKPDVYSSLGAALILLLAWSPSNLADAGFLLSFAAVLGLALFTPVLLAPLQKRLRRDPLQLPPDPAWKNALRRFGLELGGLGAMTVAATLASAPLTALYFGSVAPIGLLGNLVAVPLASLIILTGALSLALGSIALFLAGVFNHANVALAFLLHRFIAFLAAVPGGHWTVPPPPLWTILLAYALLIAIRFGLWVHATQAPEHNRAGPPAGGTNLLLE